MTLNILVFQMPKMAAILLKDGLQSRSKHIEFIKERGFEVGGNRKCSY